MAKILLIYYMYPPVNQNKDKQSIDMKTPAFAELVLRGFTIGFPYLVLIYSRLCPLACRLWSCHFVTNPVAKRKEQKKCSFFTLDSYLQMVSNNDIVGLHISILLVLRCFKKDMYGMWKYTNPDTHLCVFFQRRDRT